MQNLEIGRVYFLKTGNFSGKRVTKKLTITFK